MRPPKRLKDLDRAQRDAIGLFIKRLCMEKALAEICIYLGHQSLTDSQQRELIQIMRDNFERFDPNELWLEHEAAKRLQRSFIESQMAHLTADQFGAMRNYMHEQDE